MNGIQKNIVILGAGFAGLHAALQLAKKNLKSEYQIILIDERDVHIYTPDLYEIATAFNQKITEECLVKLKNTVAIPYSSILEGTPINFLRDKVLALHPQQKEVELKNSGNLNYDYLIIALGSVINYYDIPGLIQFSYPLKTLTDSLAINCHLDIYFHTLWKADKKEHVRIIVGGGGATGVEFACELPRCIDKICKKYGYPRYNVTISVIEASSQLAGGGDSISARILKRFEKLGITAYLNTFIKGVEVNKVVIESASGGQRELPMDILIWTGGVKPHPLIKETFSTTSKNGALPVNEFLQHGEFREIFAAGDNAYFVDKEKSAPMLAQTAYEQGKMVAHNIAAEIINARKKAYRIAIKGIIIPLGGQYAIFKRDNFIMAGFAIWLLRRLIDLFYAMKILPLPYALRKWIHDTNIFVRND